MTTDVRDTRSLPEEGFHEIQLSGKQLVFLFMATTVVCVVIFLAGVLVGRGVRGAEAADAGHVELRPAAEVGVPATGEPEPSSASPAPPTAEATPAPDDAAAAGEAPAPGAEKGKGATNAKEKAGEHAAALDYTDRLMNPQPPAENLSARKQPTESARAALPPKPAATPPAATLESAPPVPIAGSILVQVTALKQRGEADAIARRLAGKGYKAFVVGPQPGGTPLFRVRVGPFTDRAEADAVVKRLTKEEQLQPWIVR